MSWGWQKYGDYVSADEKRQRADAAIRKLEKGGRKLAPMRLTGRAIATSFWGKAWCQNLEGYSDYESRLPRGRSYLRQGAVLDLRMERGTIEATVSGTRFYEVTVKIDTLPKDIWVRLKADCAGKVGSLMDLLQGKLSAPVMEIVTRREGGLFSKPSEIHVACSCPDYADLCKHAAAVLYGVGARLDERPELLFRLRGVDHLELIAAATDSLQAQLTSTTGKPSEATLDEDSLTEIFGIELGEVATTPLPKPNHRQSSSPSRPTISGSNKKLIRADSVPAVRQSKSTRKTKRTAARKPSKRIKAAPAQARGSGPPRRR